MAWIQTDSLSFSARHDDADTGCAQRILDRLEELRLRLEERFPEAPGDVTVVIHDNPAWLSAAHPLLPAVRWAAAPAGRRYLAGWPMAGEIHVLSDEWMERRAGGEDSLRALRGTAERMYCHLVLAANNERLPPMWTPVHFITYLRWAWLIEGAAQYFSGQISMFRPAVITRLREGERPRFPPSRRDAVILGGTIFDVLDRHAGPAACSMLAARLRKEGAQANLELAFEASLRDIERAWRHHLDEILYPQSSDPGSAPLADTDERPSPLAEKPSPLRRLKEAEREVDLHDLELKTAADDVDFDAEFEDPFKGEPRIRRGSGLRSPSGSELPPAPDLDFGPAPEFGFEGSAARPVDDPDEDERNDNGGAEPEREPGGRSDPGE
ncbi:MAG: hypothetical protein M3M99_06635 [Actinomycetota bacterium]|nr:hypothetical protein [Actinomycetota bacterium]